MRILGIESSCDETAAAVVTGEGEVISDVVASQYAVHAPYGGVVPELASRAHVRNVIPVIERALEQAGGIQTIDAVAVTHGPGLIGALLVGLSSAKAICWAGDLPLIGVNHLVGHMFAVFLQREAERTKTPDFPYIALLVSGGHTAIYEVRGPGEIRILGQTRDDAAGEAYDKVGKLLGLPYPGGPVVDRLAQGGDPNAVDLPAPMSSNRTLDFSFSGLKTSVARYVKVNGIPEDPADLCAAFQRRVVRVLVKKSVHACRQHGIPRLVLGGGVAANRGLRERARQQCDRAQIELFVPALASCTDNAAMIAYAGALRLQMGEQDNLALTAFSRSPDLRRGKLPKVR
ncbi:MAG TPA: tRNA (adenosine(37)-N6)-threonylcarbamoyltransferase complex transferase subunit TsaD [Polyangiaceae bacterium]|nr:tRNA (adenosine(37)-N6)-threonylcarbamoyltransferase complex transferase subunit TsaD [Polyangiaceae bacterium]